jgi:heme exporter protein B
MNTFILFFRREWQLIFRDTSKIAQPLSFYLIVCLLFPLTLPVDNALFAKIGPGIIWVAAVLATLLGLESLFKEDYNDGTLEQYLISARSLPAAMLGKCVAQWSSTGLILTLFSPILSAAFHIPAEQIWVLFLALLLGTPSLTLIGAIGAALTVTIQRGSALSAVVILPLYIPILIFGAGIVWVSADGINIAGQLYMLAAILSACITLAPFAISSAFKATIR